MTSQPPSLKCHFILLLYFDSLSENVILDNNTVGVSITPVRTTSGETSNEVGSSLSDCNAAVTQSV